MSDPEEDRRVIDVSKWMPEEIFSLKALRANRPEWEWSAERCGFGWDYLGTRAGEAVQIRKVSAFGDEDGQAPPELRVYGAGKGDTYWAWSSKQKGAMR